MSFDLRGRIRRPVHVARGDAYARLERDLETLKRGWCFAQHDFDVANGSGATVRADINNALEALATLSSGPTAPATTYPYQLWADTTSGLLKQRNASNSGWEVRGTLAETMAVSRSSNTILGAGDYAKFFIATSTFTQTLTAAATLGDGWFVFYRVNSGATITFDPNSSENIDGATTKVVVGPAAGIIFCDGSNFFSYGFDNPSASDSVAGVIEIATQAEMETATDTTRAVVPGRVQYHPGVAKGWVLFNGTGTVAVSASHNVTSITDNGTGDYTVNWATDFSGGSYSVQGACNNFRLVALHTLAAGTTRIQCLYHVDTGQEAADCSVVSLVALGDQ